MKKRALVFTSFLLLSLMTAARAVQAQEPLVATIPFEFVAGDTTLPPGDYRIEKLGGDSAFAVTRIGGERLSAVVIARQTEGKEPQSESKLVFNRYGGHYFLSQYWTAGSSRGRQLPKSAREKEVAKIASVEPQRQVILAALSPASR